MLFNLSLQMSFVPSQWKRAAITPVAKIPCANLSSNFRPISVTSVLSRAMEKEIVHRYIYPAIAEVNIAPSLSDQFAFRPSGSTTAALIKLLSTVTEMLETEPYVHLVALDFSKAFDTLRQSKVMECLSDLMLPDNVYNWIVHFLSDRVHCTRIGSNFS
jgi:hypothetical protein